MWSQYPAHAATLLKPHSALNTLNNSRGSVNIHFISFIIFINIYGIYCLLSVYLLSVIFTRYRLYVLVASLCFHLDTEIGIYIN